MLLQKALRIASSAILCVWSVSSVAGEVGNLVTFQEDQPAFASEVNQNFDDLKTEINDNNTRISALEGGSGNIFIDPGSMSGNLAASGEFVPLAAGSSVVAVFRAPADYTGGDTETITIRPMLSGCVGFDVVINITSKFRNVGSNPDERNQQTADQTINVPAANDVLAPAFTRTGMGELTYVEVNRVSAGNCVTSAEVRGILIEYPR